MSLTRRRFLTSLGIGTYAALRALSADAAPAPFPLPRARGPAPAWFRPIAASADDALLVPAGFKCDIVCAWDDDLGHEGPCGAEKFGYNPDFIAWFPLDALAGGRNPDEGLLWVNHEYPHPLFVSGHVPGRKKDAEQIRKEKLSVGGSVIHLQRKDGVWKHVPGSKHTRRLTALYPRIELTGPAASLVPFGTGTLANCGGGRTPWMTALSCEENYQDFNRVADLKQYGHGWSEVAAEKIDEEQYGWVVEVDPFGELPPQKHSALGRFSHENTAWRIGPTGRFVVYMGDDAQDQYLYKYVSDGVYDPKASRADNRKLLTSGTLYVADFAAGKWKMLDYHRNPELSAAGFESQAEVLLHCRRASAAMKATPLDRPEDCEVHPTDGSLYIALTNNAKHGNFFGQIVRLLEDGDNPEGDSFRFEIFLAGGPQSGLACPDNLLFDRKGNLWVVCDLSSRELNRGIFTPFGNNGMFLVPTSGPSAGDAFQFASGPVDCELTGPWFTENEDTLFLAVQHPGEGSRSLDKLTSHWPEGGDAIPKPAVVAITGFRR